MHYKKASNTEGLAYNIIGSIVSKIKFVGGTARLSFLLGSGNARQIINVGNVLNAPRAYLCGIVDTVESHDKLIDEVYAHEQKQEPEARARIFLKMLKACVSSNLRMNLFAAVAFEACTTIRRETQDHKEGVEAFMEK